MKKKSDWKKIDFKANAFSKNDLDGLISFEELTDYELITPNEPSGESVRINRFCNVFSRLFRFHKKRFLRF